MDEMTVAIRLVELAIKKGYYVSVFDGEEYTVVKSQNVSLITGALNTTGEDRLSLYNNGTLFGAIWLVWGNSLDELISDYSGRSDWEMDNFIKQHESICGFK